jgi:hypothetical protein
MPAKQSSHAKLAAAGTAIAAHVEQRQLVRDLAEGDRAVQQSARGGVRHGAVLFRLGL